MIIVSNTPPQYVNIHPDRDLWYNPTSLSLHVYDGTSWVVHIHKGVIVNQMVGFNLAVAIYTGQGYPGTALAGDIWIDDLSYEPWCFDGTMWIPTIGLPNSTNGGSALTPTPSQVSIPSSSWFTMSIPTVTSVSANNIQVTSGVAQSSYISLAPPAPHLQIFAANQTDAVFTVKADGTIEFNQNYTPDEVAERFWEAIKKSSPQLLLSRIAELEKELAALRPMTATATFDPDDAYDRAMKVII